MELLTLLEQRFIREYPEFAKENASLYLYAVHVDATYTRKGIGANLYKIVEEEARKQGFKNIVSISTGPVSQHISLHKRGFEKIDEIPYQSFQFKGKSIFSALKNQACMMMIKPL